MQNEKGKIEPTKVSIGIECYIQKNGKYLVHQRNPNKRILPGVWMAPGGHAELHEGIIQATRREIREETGLEVKKIRLRAVGTGFLQDLNEFLYIYIFVAEYKSGTLTTHEKDGIFSWKTPEEIIKLDTLLEELRLILPYVFGDKPDILLYTATYDVGNHMSSFEIESTK